MPALKHLSDCEAAYIAGIIDGEGTITLTRFHRNENRRAAVSISSTELPLLHHVRSLIGAGRITTKMCVCEQHAPGFTYILTSRQALAVLAQVAPYLRTYKSQRARLLLDEYLLVTPRNGRYTPVQREARQAFEERFFSLSVRRGLSRLRGVAVENGPAVDSTLSKMHVQSRMPVSPPRPTRPTRRRRPDIEGTETAADRGPQ